MHLACRDSASTGEHFDELQDEAVWYLVDSVRPLPAKAKTVVSASLNSKVHKVSSSIIHSFARHSLNDF